MSGPAQRPTYLSSSFRQEARHRLRACCQAEVCGHREDTVVVVDAIREVKPPFSPRMWSIAREALAARLGMRTLVLQLLQLLPFLMSAIVT